MIEEDLYFDNSQCENEWIYKATVSSESVVYFQCLRATPKQHLHSGITIIVWWQVEHRLRQLLL